MGNIHFSLDDLHIGVIDEQGNITQIDREDLNIESDNNTT